MMPIILELTIIPLIAVLISLREKRFWCRKICPVGATLNLAGSISPFIKPDVKTEKCLAKGCQITSDYQHQVSCNRCESACPQGISLGKDESLIRCTKCLECYIVCEKKAVTIKPVSTPQAVSWLKQTFRRKPKIHKTNEYE
jgi:polyferredoxin